MQSILALATKLLQNIEPPFGVQNKLYVKRVNISGLWIHNMKKILHTDSWSEQEVT